MSYLEPTDLLPGECAGGRDVMTDERAALRGFLQRQRELVVWKVSGLPAEVLQAQSTPTGSTPLGIVAHLTAVERWWFGVQVAGEPEERLGFPRDGDLGHFLVPAGTSTEEVLQAYAAECARVDALMADVPLDAGDPEHGTVRWVYLHMIEETARHLGQLDLLRERADGATGEDPFP